MPKKQGPAFKRDNLAPIVERLIAFVSSQHGYATRDAVASALAADSEGQRFLNAALGELVYRGAKVYSSEHHLAGNMVDWFSADFTSAAPRTNSARVHFDRAKLNHKWCYYRKGTYPAFREAAR